MYLMIMIFFSILYYTYTRIAPALVKEIAELVAELK